VRSDRSVYKTGLDASWSATMTSPAVSTLKDVAELIAHSTLAYGFGTQYLSRLAVREEEASIEGKKRRRLAPGIIAKEEDAFAAGLERTLRVLNRRPTSANGTKLEPITLITNLVKGLIEELLLQWREGTLMLIPTSFPCLGWYSPAARATE
jgi:hypothetical protein